jgi:alpha-N-acetylgalactosaminidase
MYRYLNRYRCNMNCKDDPDNCFSEKLIKKIIDEMASGGYKEAGYEYVNLDDCWQAEERAANGHLQAHPENFPSGIKALADYAHGKGLKLGLYTAMGNGTCANDDGRGEALGLGCDFTQIPACPRAKMDIDDFVDWGIDHLKVKAQSFLLPLQHLRSLFLSEPGARARWTGAASSTTWT